MSDTRVRALLRDGDLRVLVQEGLALRRLPTGLRQAVVDGVDGGTIQVVEGHRFSLSGLRPGKGPYAFFSRSASRAPAPNWEYFVQVAEYVRVARAVAPRGLRIDFEDDLMDVSVYDANSVLWCIEVKEKATDLNVLLAGMRRGAQHVDPSAPDRHNDPLWKSKTLMRHRPLYFSLVAIGSRLDFSVSYTADGFALTEDLVRPEPASACRHRTPWACPVRHEATVAEDLP